MNKEDFKSSLQNHEISVFEKHKFEIPVPRDSQSLVKAVTAEHYAWNDSFSCLSIDSKDEAESCCCDDEWDSSDSQPRGERWPPLGAPNDDDEKISLSSDLELKWYGQRAGSPNKDNDRLRELEDEQEQLNSSLLALTSHFAQVQFRLKQIVNASPVEKEDLLVELEEFANRGIPDLRQNGTKSPKLKKCDRETRLDIGQERQKELITQLKQQLEDLENYAYQTGEAGLPQSIVLQKQRVIIDQLKGKLNLNVDDFDKLTIDDLKLQVDKAIKDLINPLRMKEQLVDQLQTQIVDLERYIEFLQEDGSDDPFNLDGAPMADCKCEGHVQPQTTGASARQRRPSSRTKRTNSFRQNEREQMTRDTEGLINKATTLLSMLSFAQFGCGPAGKSFEKNLLKKTASGYHWGDLRAALEMSIASVCEVIEISLLEDANCDSESDSRARESIPLSSETITLAVRKKLCPSLRDLIQHGLMPVGQSRSVVPFLSCLPQRSQKSHQMLHAWDFILQYYLLKKGDQYNRTPARKLSQSFNLEITGGAAVTNKQLLLQTIGSILSSHGPLKRSYDSHFKAFVSAGLNKKKLITWLRLIFRTQSLVENYYQSWSYVAKTGFEDSFRSLEKFSAFNFQLPVDIAVKPFQNIKDVFN